MAVNVVTVNGVTCRLAGGVREMTDTVGTGTYSLRGAKTVDEITYRTVVAGIGSGNASVFTVRLGASFETFIGTVTSGTPSTLTRQQILESSNNDAAVSWGAGEKDLILDAPAAVFNSLQSQTNTVVSNANTLTGRVTAVENQADDLQAQINAITGAGPVLAVTRFKTTVFTGNGTLTTDADTMFAWVKVVGGGGAGGGAAANGSDFGSSEGGGGGGGEYAEGYFTAAQLGASKSVTVGTGGSGVSNGTGGGGGTTNFGSGLVTAAGGSGGSAMASSSTENIASGGAGGTGGTGGTFRVQGGQGMKGIVHTYSTWPGPVNFGILGYLGKGGSSVLGHAKHSPETQAVGQTYGAGGNGAGNLPNSAAKAGGAGGNGVCIVVEYLHD